MPISQGKYTFHTHHGQQSIYYDDENFTVRECLEKMKAKYDPEGNEKNIHIVYTIERGLKVDENGKYLSPEQYTKSVTVLYTLCPDGFSLKFGDKEFPNCPDVRLRDIKWMDGHSHIWFSKN